VGDVVTAFDSRDIADFEALRLAVEDCRPNESVVLTVRRGDEQLNVRVRLGRKQD
jgi:S1-C subfamily serine protease